MTLDDLELHKFEFIFSEFRGISQILDARTAKRMKVGQYCQRQRCKHVELEQFWQAFASRGFVSDSSAFLFLSSLVSRVVQVKARRDGQGCIGGGTRVYAVYRPLVLLTAYTYLI